MSLDDDNHYSPERLAEIRELVAQFRTGAEFIDPDTKMEWEFLEDLPGGGMMIRKISGWNGSKKKVTWRDWNVKFEFNRVIEARMRKELEELGKKLFPLFELKASVRHFLQTGQIDQNGKNYEPLIRAAASGDDTKLIAWIEATAPETAEADRLMAAMHAGRRKTG